MNESRHFANTNHISEQSSIYYTTYTQMQIILVVGVGGHKDRNQHDPTNPHTETGTAASCLLTASGSDV